jgi:hypothetical protein
MRMVCTLFGFKLTLVILMFYYANIGLRGNVAITAQSMLDKT